MAFTPYFTKADTIRMVNLAAELFDKIDSQPRLPFGQYVSDSEANRQVVARHLAVRDKAREVWSELSKIYSELRQLEKEGKRV